MLVFDEWDEIGIAFNVDNKDPLIWVPIAIRVLEQVEHITGGREFLGVV